MPSVQGLVFKIDKHLRAECGLPQYDVCRIEGGIEIGKGTLAQANPIQRFATRLDRRAVSPHVFIREPSQTLFQQTAGQVDEG